MGNDTKITNILQAFFPKIPHFVNKSLAEIWDDIKEERKEVDYEIENFQDNPDLLVKEIFHEMQTLASLLYHLEKTLGIDVTAFLGEHFNETHDRNGERSPREHKGEK